MAYSEAQTAEALAVLAANEGNISATKRELRAAGWERVPAHKTFNRWLEQPSKEVQRASAIGEKTNEKKAELSAVFEQIVRRSLQVAGTKLDQASFDSLMRAAGIGTDKMQLLRGEATDIREQRGGGVNFYQQINQRGEKDE